jgi:hypothetical protein
MQFPSVSAHNLVGKRYDLPEEFEGHYNLLVINFYQHQPHLTQPWLGFGEELSNTYPAFKYYNMPTNHQQHPFEQRINNMTLRIHISDPKQRELTVALYVDLKQFCQDLEIEHRRDLVVLLVDGSGEVLWRTEGHYSELRGISLLETLETVFTESV